MLRDGEYRKQKKKKILNKRPGKSTSTSCALLIIHSKKSEIAMILGNCSINEKEKEIYPFNSSI